jgi:type IX secretion system PorP/SprF family membrane protein
MGKRGLTGLLLLFCLSAYSQLLDLPPDFRQHTMLDYNASLFNPAFSLRQTSEHRVGLWTRWQWQGIDSDPTTLYFNYSRKQERMAYGAGYFQHNTGLFQQRGGVLNFAYRLPLGDNVQLALGVNMIGYQQELLDDRLLPGEPILPIDDEVRDFIFQLSPGLELQVENFALGFSSENFLDYNFTENESVSESDEKIITLMGRYEFVVSENAAGGATYLQPMLYYRRVPGFDNQVGLNALWSAPGYWAQAGYNSFYGFSIGAGAKLFEKVSLGALLETGSNDNPVGGNTSYEVVLAFTFGEKEPLPPEEEEIKEDLIVEQEAQDEEEARLAAEIEAQQKAMEEAARRQELAMEQRQDSIRQAEELALVLQRRQDSIREAEQAAVALSEKVVPEKGEKYQEVSGEEGLEPGFYLIANVFGTKKYYTSFMQRLSDSGLQPKSFYRDSNKFNYVYLKRYNSIGEARKARDSKFDGRYEGDLWIFRIR